MTDDEESTEKEVQLLERLLARSPSDPATGCSLRVGSKTSPGYGNMYLANTTKYAHRLAA